MSLACLVILIKFEPNNGRVEENILVVRVEIKWRGISRGVEACDKVMKTYIKNHTCVVWYAWLYKSMKWNRCENLRHQVWWWRVRVYEQREQPKDTLLVKWSCTQLSYPLVPTHSLLVCFLLLLVSSQGRKKNEFGDMRFGELLQVWEKALNVVFIGSSWVVRVFVHGRHAFLLSFEGKQPCPLS